MDKMADKVCSPTVNLLDGRLFIDILRCMVDSSFEVSEEEVETCFGGYSFGC